MNAWKTVPALIAAFLVTGAADATPVPARFINDQIFVEAEAPDGETLTFFTDTGGGWSMVAASVAERHAFEPRGSATGDGGAEIPLVAFPEFLEAAGIPRPAVDRFLKGNLVPVADRRVSRDGMLGSRWFADGIWYFDYEARTLTRLNSADRFEGWPVAPLGFRKNAAGVRDLSFPRVVVTVAGEPIDMLLDTGATARLSADAASMYGLEAGDRVGTSYIVQSIFERWRSAHPDWRVIAGGDTVLGGGADMIEVPQVEVAGVTVGPAWFATRPDTNFHDGITPMMDKRVDGAVGGSAFRYLQLVIDYPDARLYVRKLEPHD